MPFVCPSVRVILESLAFLGRTDVPQRSFFFLGRLDMDLCTPRENRASWFVRMLLCLSLMLVAGDADRAAAETPQPFRKLVPGVETRVPLKRAEEETHAMHDVVELIDGEPDLQWSPEEHEVSKTLHSKAQDVLFRRGVWQLQFTHKPLRLIEVDIPQPDGKMKRKVVWYMVYRITNPGQHLTPVQGEHKPLPSGDRLHPGEYKIQEVDSNEAMLANVGPHRFVPTFLLRTFDNEKLDIDKNTVQYMDQIIPAARREIYNRERPNCKYEEFFDSSQISQEPIPVSSGRDEISRWGVATWTDIDSKIDFLTMQIMGLTNAYKWVDPPSAYKPKDAPGTGRQFEYKTLQLNFYRPGDSLDQREEEIQQGVEGHPKHEWLYRPAPTTYDPVHPRS